MANLPTQVNYNDPNNYKPCKKKSYEIYACIPPIGTVVINKLEQAQVVAQLKGHTYFPVDYLKSKPEIAAQINQLAAQGMVYKTDEKNCIVLCGTRGEMWTMSKAKLAQVYRFVRGDELIDITEESFKNMQNVTKSAPGTLNWVRIKTKPTPAGAYTLAACWVPRTQQFQIQTSWGAVLTGNFGNGHGLGDFVMAGYDAATKQVNMNSRYIVNGLVFKDTYDNSGFTDYIASESKNSVNITMDNLPKLWSDKRSYNDLSDALFKDIYTWIMQSNSSVVDSGNARGTSEAIMARTPALSTMMLTKVAYREEAAKDPKLKPDKYYDTVIAPRRSDLYASKEPLTWNLDVILKKNNMTLDQLISTLQKTESADVMIPRERSNSGIPVCIAVCERVIRDVLDYSLYRIMNKQVFVRYLKSETVDSMDLDAFHNIQTIVKRTPNGFAAKVACFDNGNVARAVELNNTDIMGVLRTVYSHKTVMSYGRSIAQTRMYSKLSGLVQYAFTCVHLSIEQCTAFYTTLITNIYITLLSADLVDPSKKLDLDTAFSSSLSIIMSLIGDNDNNVSVYANLEVDKDKAYCTLKGKTQGRTMDLRLELSDSYYGADLSALNKCIYAICELLKINPLRLYCTAQVFKYGFVNSSLAAKYGLTIVASVSVRMSKWADNNGSVICDVKVEKNKPCSFKIKSKHTKLNRDTENLTDNATFEMEILTKSADGTTVSIAKWDSSFQGAAVLPSYYIGEHLSTLPLTSPNATQGTGASGIASGKANGSILDIQSEINAQHN